MKRFGPSPPCLLLLLSLCPRVPPIFLAPPVGLGVPSISPPPSIPSPTPANPTISHATETGGIHRRPKEYIPFPFLFLFLCRSTRILFYVSLPNRQPRFSLHYLFAIISNSGSTTFSFSRSHACTLREISLLAQRADVACFESVRSNAPTMSQLSCLRNFLDFILRIMAILRYDDIQAKLRDIFAARRHADQITFKVSIIKV